ncbi:MAG: hypothetical protein ACREDK_06150 [Thermoplasmata archaeon]
MIGSEGLPTRVGPGLKGLVAHGPPKEWDKVGLNVVVSVTIPATQVRWARAHGYVLSRVLRESLERLQGGSDLDRIERELESAHEQLRILEAARDRLREKRQAADGAKNLEKAREEAIRRLAEEFRVAPVQLGGVTGHRPALGRATANVRWLEERVSKSDLLRAMKPSEVLDLILALCEKEGAP